MIFDQLCGFAERYLPGLIPRLRDAKLFEFPGRAHEVLADHTYEDFGGVDFLVETFFLPYPVVCVEDTASCIVLWDADNAADPQGLDQMRYFVECLPVDPRRMGEFQHTDASPEEVSGLLRKLGCPDDTCLVTVGSVKGTTADLGGSRKIIYAGLVSLAMYASKTNVYLSPQQVRASGAFQTVADSALRNVNAAIDEILYFNMPGRFVVEQSPTNAKHSAQSAKKLLRTHERPRYTLLTPGEIRKRMKLPEVGDGVSVSPHFRRRHYRKYTDDRFIHMKGKMILVPACWVGDREAIVGNTRYRVALEV